MTVSMAKKAYQQAIIHVQLGYSINRINDESTRDACFRTNLSRLKNPDEDTEAIFTHNYNIIENERQEIWSHRFASLRLN